MKLTREETVSCHRKMWNWIADRIEEEKEYQYIGILKKEYCEQNNFFIENDCFCCEFAKGNCFFCPIEWDSNLEEYMCEQKYKECDGKGLYGLCCESTNWKEQVKLAREIANLQEKDGNNENRLTYITELGVCLDKDDKCHTCSICWNCSIPVRECPYIYDALEKLAEYEDTKLTPEQVLQVKERNTLKKPHENCCPEKTHYKCPNCGYIFLTIYTDGYRLGTTPSYCERCGKKIDWSELN